jgi:hypothetical protein
MIDGRYLLAQVADLIEQSRQKRRPAGDRPATRRAAASILSRSARRGRFSMPLRFAPLQKLA